MIQIKRSITRLCLIVILMLFYVVFSTQNASAANITMLLASSASSVQKGALFVVDLQVQAGPASIMDTVATVNFNASHLNFEGVSYQPSSSWATEGPDADSGTGYYTVDVLGSPVYPSGNITLARLTFKAIVDSGSTTLTISNASAGDGADPITPHSVAVQGVSINLQPAPTANQPPNPGTVIPVNSSSNSGVSTTPTSFSTEADIVNQGTPVTDETQIAEATKQNEQAAQTVEEEQDALSAVSSTDTDDNNLILIFVGFLSVILLIGSGVYLYKKSKNKKLKARNDSTLNNNNINKEHAALNDSLSGVKSPDTPKAGSVVSPKDENKG